MIECMAGIFFSEQTQDIQIKCHTRGFSHHIRLVRKPRVSKNIGLGTGGSENEKISGVQDGSYSINNTKHI